MREAKLAGGRDLVVVPGLTLMRTAQIEHRFEAVLPDRPADLGFAQLRRTVQDARAYRVKIALVLENSPITRDHGGDQCDQNPGYPKASQEPRNRPRPVRPVALSSIAPVQRLSGHAAFPSRVAVRGTIQI